MSLNKYNNNEYVNLSNFNARYAFLWGLLAWLGLLILFILLNAYFSESLYCEGIDNSFDTAAESGPGPEGNREDNTQVDSRFNSTE